MSQTKWNEIACEVFHVKPNRLDSLTLLDRIQQTGTFSDLDNPFKSGSITRAGTACWFMTAVVQNRGLDSSRIAVG